MVRHAAMAEQIASNSTKPESTDCMLKYGRGWDHRHPEEHTPDQICDRKCLRNLLVGTLSSRKSVERARNFRYAPHNLRTAQGDR